MNQLPYEDQQGPFGFGNSQEEPVDPEEIERERQAKEALGQTTQQRPSGSAVADILYQAYTGKQSPVAALTLQERKQDGDQRMDAIKQVLSEKRLERQAANEDADRKFKIAEYLNNKRLAEAKLGEDRRQFDTKLGFDRWKTEQDARQAEQKKQAGQAIPSGTAKELGELDAALGMADSLDTDYKNNASGFGSSITQFFKGSDANLYEKKRDVAAQTIGGILEGGKLTDHDYKRYRSMLPAPTDSNEQAAAKMSAIKDLITAKRAGSVNALSQAGYNLGGYSTGSGAATANSNSSSGNSAQPAPEQAIPEEKKPKVIPRGTRLPEIN